MIGRLCGFARLALRSPAPSGTQARRKYSGSPLVTPARRIAHLSCNPVARATTIRSVLHVPPIRHLPSTHRVHFEPRFPTVIGRWHRGIVNVEDFHSSPASRANDGKSQMALPVVGSSRADNKDDDPATVRNEDDGRRVIARSAKLGFICGVFVATVITSVIVVTIICAAAMLLFGWLMSVWYNGWP